MHLLKFFLPVFVCFGPLFVRVETGNSSLSLIYNDLSIVARITNAISLQKRSIEKDVKARKVITELLKAHPESFDELMAMDPKKLMNELETVFDISSQIAKGSVKTGPEWKAIEHFNDGLGYAMNTNLSTDVPGLMKNLTSSSFRDALMICDMKTVQVVINFYKAMNSSSSNDLNKIRALKEKRKEVMKCLDSIADYKTTVDPTVHNIYEFKLIVGARDFCNDYSDQFSDFTNFHENIILLKNLATKAKKIWKRPRLYERVSRMGKLLETISDHDNEPKPDLCAGFMGVDDTAKVLEDVRSPWFQKEIAKGRSTKDLEKALEPFGKFAKKLGEFKSIWLKFNEAIRQEGVFAEEMSDLLVGIEKYSDLENAETFLDNAATSYKKTWHDSNPKPFDAKPLGAFDRKLGTVSHILSLAGRIEKLCRQLVSEYDFTTLAHVLNDIEKLDLSKSEKKDLKKMITGVKHYDSLHDFFKNFLVFYKYQSDLNKSHGNLGQDFTTIVADGTAFIKNSTFSQNLNARSYNTTKFDEALQFFRKVLKFDDVMMRKEAKEHFETFDKLKNDYLKLEEFVKSLGSTSSALIGDFRNASMLAQTYGRGVHVFRDISEAYVQREAIYSSMGYDESVNDFIDQIKGHDHLSKFWGSYNRITKMEKLIDELQTLEQSVKPFVSKDFETLRQALNMAVNVTGLQGFENGFRDILDQLSVPNRLHKTVRDDAIENSQKLADLDLDFSSHKGDLLAASMSFDNIRDEFNTMFGLNPKHEKKSVKNAWFVVVIISICVFLLLVVAVLLIYGLTERGRNQYKNLYLFYFGKPEDFEKRWRYSLFMDRKDGKNALMDATREIHAINVEKEAKRGAFIDFYNEFGNTALHLSSKRGYAEIVEVLIKNGADRSLLNYQNRTPEQMIPENYQETYPEKVEKYKKIEAIYSKYRNKKFRKRVPEVFPSSSFHIYAEDKADIDLTNAFMAKFKAIVTPTLIPATTHCVVKTDPDGVLEIDGFEYLTWIMNGVIIVKESWMTDCLKNPKLIEKDSKYLVEKVRFKDVEYDTVTQWSKAMAKGEMPYLYGVYVCIVMKEQKNVFYIASIVNAHGGTMCEGFPMKVDYNIGSHPYNHAHLGPLFVISDGSTDLTLFKNDPDKMYTIITEDEFVHFLLKREINRDTKLDPIQATKESDD